ncbi:MAG: aldehyde dehydrogenase family protein [Lacunisphaera sp.]
MTTSPRGLLIDGKETPASTGKTLDRRNPADGSLVATYAEAGAADVENAIRSARRAFAAGPWRQTNGADRAALLSRVAALIRRETEPLAQLETRESGKPIAQARAEMDWAAGLWDYAAALARQLSGGQLQHPGTRRARPDGA